MKRGLTIFDALFLLALVAKATNTKLFGHGVSWFNVFSPYLVYLIVLIIEIYLTREHASERLRFFFWRMWVNNKARKARKTAEQEFKTAYKKGRQAGNPGQAYDTK